MSSDATCIRFFGVAAAFLKVTNLGGWNGATYTRPMVDTVVLGPIMVTPGGGWSKATQTKFEASPAGDVPGVEKLPSYLQGNNHRDLFTFADFVINFREPGRCIVTLGTAAKAGAHPSLSRGRQTSCGSGICRRRHRYPREYGVGSGDPYRITHDPPGKYLGRTGLRS